MNTVDCDQVQELAEELALGTLTGSARAQALEHIEECSACRRTQTMLAEAADVVLLLAPWEEPSAGFETRVLARLYDDATPVRLRHRRASVSTIGRWVAPLAATAAAVVVAWFLVAGLPTTETKGRVEVAAMRTGMGERIGTASIHDADPTRIELSISGWTRDPSAPAPTRYFLAVEQQDGPRELVELAPFDGMTWKTPIPVDADDVQSVAVVDGQGRTYCSARFTDSN